MKPDSCAFTSTLASQQLNHDTQHSTLASQQLNRDTQHNPLASQQLNVTGPQFRGCFASGPLQKNTGLSEETERRSNTLSAPKETSTDSQHRQKRALTLENTDTHFKEYGYSL